jgi:hypothetical protein
MRKRLMLGVAVSALTVAMLPGTVGVSSRRHHRAVAGGESIDLSTTPCRHARPWTSSHECRDGAAIGRAHDGGPAETGGCSTDRAPTHTPFGVSQWRERWHHLTRTQA